MADRRTAAVPLLVAGLPHVEVADRVGVCPQTVSRWLADEDFRAEVEAERLQATAEAREALAGAALLAVQALVSVASDCDAAPGSRVSAACAILDRVGLERGSRVEVGVTAQGDEQLRDWLLHASDAELERCALSGAIPD
jgi:transcriptional regulator with XRE-family HTH domain